MRFPGPVRLIAPVLVLVSAASITAAPVHASETGRARSEHPNYFFSDRRNDAPRYLDVARAEVFTGSSRNLGFVVRGSGKRPFTLAATNRLRLFLDTDKRNSVPEYILNVKNAATPNESGGLDVVTTGKVKRVSSWDFRGPNVSCKVIAGPPSPGFWGVKISRSCLDDPSGVDMSGYLSTSTGNEQKDYFPARNRFPNDRLLR